MAWSTVLQKVADLVVVHPEQELLLEHLHVSVPFHGGLGGKEVQGAPAANAGKAAPHHDARRVLNIDHCVLLLVAVVLRGPLHPLGP
jgi:hypothetical protein